MIRKALAVLLATAAFYGMMLVPAEGNPTLALVLLMGSALGLGAVLALGALVIHLWYGGCW
jgi:hypothetical protein